MPLCWDEVGERKILGPKLIDMTTEKIKIIWERIKIAQSRKKFYADKRKHPLEFQKEDFVFLRISPWKGVTRFGKKGKLSPKYIGPYEVLPWHIDYLYI